MSASSSPLRLTPAAPITRWSASAEPATVRRSPEPSPSATLISISGTPVASAARPGPRAPLERSITAVSLPVLPVIATVLVFSTVAPPAHGTLLSVSARGAGGDGRRLVRVQGDRHGPGSGRTGGRLRARRNHERGGENRAQSKPARPRWTTHETEFRLTLDHGSSAADRGIMPGLPAERASESRGSYVSASSKKPTTRRSYSSGRAASPPTWRDSGISHSVLLAPAAAW